MRKTIDPKKAFDDLHSLIQKRQVFESQHPSPPYTTFSTTINFSDVHGRTLLHYAIESGDLFAVKDCISKGANVNIKAGDEELSALQIAIQHNKLDVAIYLLNQLPNQSEQEVGPYHPGEAYQWLCNIVTSSIVESYPLLDVDKLVQQKTNSYFNDKTNLVHLFLRCGEVGYIDYFRWLDNYIAKNSTAPKELEPKFQKLIMHCLQAAAKNGRLETIKFIIESGIATKAGINFNNSFPEDIFQSALKHHHQHIVMYLVNSVSDVDMLLSYQQSMLMLAIENQNEEATQYILSKKPNLSSKDYFGNTALHKAAQSGNVNISNMLLSQPEIEESFSQKNIYGFTPLEVSDTNVPLPQTDIMAKIFYYQRLEYRDKDLFNQEGLCNGLSYLMHFYSAQGKRNYFLDSLRLMVSWNGDEKELDNPFNSDIPQAEFYPNLRGLFEQWLSDLIWFQQSGKLTQFTTITQSERSKQHTIINGDPNFIPIITYDTERNGRISYNEEQLKEVLHYFAKMPIGTHLELNIFVKHRGAGHATAAYIDDDHLMRFYDSNLSYQPGKITNINNFYRILIETQRKIQGVDENDKEIVGIFRIFYFLKDKAIFDEQLYQGFKDHELPKTTQDARLFQNKSPNQYTFLHAAIIRRDLSSLKKIIADNFCEINAVDRFGRQAVELAVENNFTQAAVILLNHPQCKISADDEFNKAGEYLNTAIVNNNAELIKTLLKTFKLDINGVYSYNYQRCDTPLIIAIKNNCSLDTIKLLLENGAELLTIPFLSNPEYPHPLAQIIYFHPEYYKFCITYINDINQKDAAGNALIHYAIKSLNSNTIIDLVQRNADLFSKNSAKLIPLDTLIIDYDRYNTQQLQQIISAIVARADYANNHNKYAGFAFALLYKAIISGNETIFNLLINHVDKELLNRYDQSGLTLLHRAVNVRNFEMVQALIEKDVDINARTTSIAKNTCLHTMIINEHPTKFIKLFLDRNALLNTLNGEGKTISQLASECNNQDIKSMIELYKINAGPAKNRVS